MTHLTEARLAELERLEKAASPVPCGVATDMGLGNVYISPYKDGFYEFMPANRFSGSEIDKTNADLSVALRNEADAILQELREAREVLRWYARIDEPLGGTRARSYLEKIGKGE